MQAMECAEQFYAAYRNVLWEALPDVMPAAVVGLVGEGSECLLLDDAVSQDHDAGPAFCIWLPQDVYAAHAARCTAALNALPQFFAGRQSRFTTQEAGRRRVGFLCTEDFYHSFTGLHALPSTWEQWLAIPEYHLCSCTNGHIFEDASNGHALFMQWRNTLSQHYPRDVHLKKMAGACMRMAQAGQYNFPRSLQRGARLTALLALSRFVEAATGFVFLCNKRYAPFYKWSTVLGSTLPLLGDELRQLLHAVDTCVRGETDLFSLPDAIEHFCACVATYLQTHGVSQYPEAWLWGHGPEIYKHIQDPAIRATDMLQE